MIPERDRYVVECEKTIAALREELRLQNEANDMLGAERDSWSDRARRAEADTRAAFDLSAECRARAVKAEAERDALRQELGYIANAKRFDRTMFDDDTSFADWAQSRCRAALLAGKKGK